MQQQVEGVAYREYQQNFPQTVVRGKIRHGQYARAHAVPDDDARRFKKAELGFALYL